MFARTPARDPSSPTAAEPAASTASSRSDPAGGLGARPTLSASPDTVLQLKKNKRRFRGRTMSWDEFKATPFEQLLPQTLRAHPGTDDARAEAAEDLENQRVLGHAPTSEATEEETVQIHGVIGGLKQARRDQKGQIEDALYNSDVAQPDAYEARLGNYTRDLAGTQVTNQRTADALAAHGYTVEHDRDNLQTRIMKDGRHVHTLHSGTTAYTQYAPGWAPAFMSNNAAKQIKRPFFTKLGAPGKLYVADDYGVPTRRDAYAVKSGGQMTRLAEQGYLTGRHTGVRGLPADQATRGERAMLGDPAQRRLTDSELLYIHQEFGSSDRQRGVSATSTPRPLLSNAGDGFANKEITLPNTVKALRTDPDARKLTIDTARITPRRRNQPPKLVNFHHKIPGLNRAVDAPTLYRTSGKPGQEQTGAQQYGPDRNQQHFDWSVGKNRELYIDRVTPRIISSTGPVTVREQFRGPSSRHAEATESQRLVDLALQRQQEAAQRALDRQQRGNAERLRRQAQAQAASSSSVQTPQDSKSDSDD